MIPEEFVTYLKEIETPDCNSINFYQKGYREPREAEITSNNLLLYLKKMQSLNPKILLVGEAPGYKGCKLSGIPFTSEYHILHEEFFKDGFAVFDRTKPNKEASACAIWEVLSGINKLPLMWNIYPFHPMSADGRNGKPKSQDIELGKKILENLLTMFNIEEIYCIGIKSMDTLANHQLYRGYIRHPSYGGRKQCIDKLLSILQNDTTRCIETKISREEFDEIVEKYKNDDTLWTEFVKDPERVKKDIYNACKFNLVEFGDTYPNGAWYYMNSLSD